MRWGDPKKILCIHFLLGFVCILTHKKENLPKATLKAKKGHVYSFLLNIYQLDPYIQLRSVDINGIKGIPAFRHGSLLYSPYKRITSSLLVLWHNGGLSSKNPVFKVAFFSENRARSGKIEKIRPLLICNIPPIIY